MRRTGQAQFTSPRRRLTFVVAHSVFHSSGAIALKVELDYIRASGSRAAADFPARDLAVLRSGPERPAGEASPGLRPASMQVDQGG